MLNLPARYTKIKEFSGGGMSETLLCTDSHLDRSVVIKALKPGIEKHRLLDELSALSDIRSKHVVQVLDVITDPAGEIVGLVEEHIDGVPMAPLTGSETTQEILRIFYAITSGISDVHMHGRLHRDLKPENMMFDGSGVIKLIDFGLSKLSSNANTKQLYFSKGYSAPEIFKQNPNGEHTFTEAVDVFGFGATALWLLNKGMIPSDLEDIPPTLPCAGADFHTLNNALPKQVCDLLNSCLDKNAASRPNANALKMQFERHLLFNQHRMLLTHKAQETIVDCTKSTVKLEAGQDSVSIGYDGLDFSVTAVSGFVLRNNRQLRVGDVLTGASVIVLGDPNGDKRERTSITADVTHPEVIL